jgi:hypothetical protein
MKSIDFLPEIYRKREALRLARVWWAVVVLVFGSAIGSSAAAQLWLRYSLQLQFDDLTASYHTAQAQVRELTDLQTQITKCAHEASLFTYLSHPWPRTQLMAEVVRPLPDAIRLTQLYIHEEELPRPTPQAGPRRLTPEEEAEAKLMQAEQDLKRLQEETDFRQTVIELEGHTTDVGQLHEYVLKLSHSPLVASTNIKSLEATPDKQRGLTQFMVRVVIRPGYGQRGYEGSTALHSVMPNLQPNSPLPTTSPPGAVPGGGGGA